MSSARFRRCIVDNASLNPGSCLTGMVSSRITFECNHQFSAVVLNFVLADSEGVVLIRKLVHLNDHLFSAAVFDHGAPEGLVAHVPVVDTIVPLFATFLCKLMCRVVFFASRSFAIPVTTWSVFSDVIVRDGE